MSQGIQVGSSGLSHSWFISWDDSSIGMGNKSIVSWGNWNSWDSSIGSWGSSNSGNWSSSCVSIGIWVSIAIVGSWDNSSRG